MADISTGEHLSVSKLILVPAIITLGITILRLVGELQHWPGVLFGRAAGGGGAIVGISWLPFIFGPHFALKLIHTGDRPSSIGKTIGFSVLGFVLMMGGAILAFAKSNGSLFLVLAGLLVVVAGIAVQFAGWPSLAKAMFAYAYAARIPVAIIMYFAMAGNWGTHYDAVPPDLGSMSVFAKWAYLGLAPQLVMWIAYTMSVGALFGGIVAAFKKGGQTQSQSGA